jgi:hypothetical protein
MLDAHNRGRPLRVPSEKVGRPTKPQQKTRLEGGFFRRVDPAQGSDAEALVALLELRQAAAAVEQRLLVHAGCVVGSMSRLSVSPSLPQVERVRYSVPSVITTLMVW